MAFLDTILNLITSLISKQGIQASVTIPIPMEMPIAPPSQSEVDWKDPACKISKYFTVKDAVYLNSWQTYHQPTDDQKQTILGIALGVDKALDLISQKLGRAVEVKVHAWMRPDHAICPGNPHNGEDYNKWVYWNEVWKGLTEEEKSQKHVPLSPHRTGHAIDFHVVGFEGVEGCANIRQMIVDHLEELGLRMEDIVGDWIHWDNLAVKLARFFKP